ncbi:hypothetical protein ACTFIR_012859 [Dictyostelium discoideum]
MWPNIDIDNGINHDDIIFYNNPDRSNSEKLQYLEHKFPGTGFSENPSIYSGSKGTYVKGFHLNERIASFLLLDPIVGAQQIIFYQCIMKNIECGTVKEIKWRLQNVGEAFSIYKKNNNKETRKNIINLNFVMCKILELMHLPNLTQFWPMISSSERLSKVVNFWSDLIEILRKEEVNRCRVYLCYPCVGKRVLHCKAIYFPWTNNDPHVVRTKQYTEFKEKENNIYFQKGYYTSDSRCSGWYVIEEAIKKKRQEKNN